MLRSRQWKYRRIMLVEITGLILIRLFSRLTCLELISLLSLVAHADLPLNIEDLLADQKETRLEFGLANAIH